MVLQKFDYNYLLLLKVGHLSRYKCSRNCITILCNTIQNSGTDLNRRTAYYAVSQNKCHVCYLICYNLKKLKPIASKAMYDFHSSPYLCFYTLSENTLLHMFWSLPRLPGRLSTVSVNFSAVSEDFICTNSYLEIL